MINKILPIALLSFSVACGDKEDDTAASEESEESEETEESEEAEESEESSEDA